MLVHAWDMGLVVRFFYARGGDQWGGARFVKQVLQTAERAQADVVIAATDPDGPTWRHIEFPRYKAHRNRKDATAILRQQLIAIEGLQRNGVHVFGAEGFEADDVIAAVAKAASDDGHEVVVFSGDKDIGQLMLMPRVHIHDGKFEVTPEDIYEKFGVRLEQLVDFLAIAGDASDGVPGVQGVGPTGAAKLLAAHGTLDAVIEAARIMPKASALYRKLAEQADAALLSRRLIVLGSRAVPLPPMPWRS